MDYIDPTLPTAHNKADRGLRGVHLPAVFGSRGGSTLAYPTLVLHDGVAELAASSRRDLGVVPAQQLEAPSVRLVLQVKVRHGVEAVVGQVLRGTRRQHLQEPYLVAVCLVVNL